MHDLQMLMRLLAPVQKAVCSFASNTLTHKEALFLFVSCSANAVSMYQSYCVCVCVMSPAFQYVESLENAALCGSDSRAVLLCRQLPCACSQCQLQARNARIQSIHFILL